MVRHSRSSGDRGGLGERLRYESDPLSVTSGERERPRPRRWVPSFLVESGIGPGRDPAVWAKGSDQLPSPLIASEKKPTRGGLKATLRQNSGDSD